jgi:phospholipase/carboxylesterase
VPGAAVEASRHRLPHRCDSSLSFLALTHFSIPQDLHKIMKRSHATKPSRPSTEALLGSAFGDPSGLFTPSARDWARTLFVPLHYEPNYAYPLIVWLHGPGRNERQLLEIMPQVSRRNYVGVAPRGPGLGRDALGREICGWSQSPEHVHEAEQRIFDSIDAVGRRLNIAADRMLLAGFDSGGTMALRVALGHPWRFAGVLSIGGAFPSGQTPLAEWPRARNLLVFLAIGRRSLQYPPARACDDLRLLHAAGLAITLREYPQGHYLSPQILGDMDRWIMDRVVNGSIARLDSCSPPARSPERADRE